MKNIPLFKVFSAPNMGEKLQPIFDSGYTGQGSQVELFEKKLKSHFGTDYCLYVNSGTSAIHLALCYIKEKYNLSNDTEVLSFSVGCYASVACILNNDLRVKWVDTDPSTMNIDLLDAERKLSPTTRILMILHNGSYPVNMDRVNELKLKYLQMYGQELFVVEDCCHCFSSSFRNKIIGNFGNFACFSYQSIKFLNTVDGGLIITPDTESYHDIKLARWFGLNRDAGASFRAIQDIKLPYVYKMQPTDVGATIGLNNYEHINGNINIHRDNAGFYNTKLNNVGSVQLLQHDNPVYISDYWIYGLHVPSRDSFIKMMASHGIECSPIQARLYKHTSVKRYFSSLPQIEQADKTIVYIPNGYWVTKEDREFIVDKIKGGW